MWKFISAARLAQIKADARAEGYIKAVREGIAANDTANRAVQVMDKAAQESVTKVKETGIKRKRYGSKGPYKMSKYSDPDIKLVNDGRQIESIIVSSIGEKTCDEIAAEINKTMGTHARGAFNPIKITDIFVSTVVRRHRVWDDKHGYFVNKTGH